MRVLISGVSTRAAAGSAARAGFDVTAIDAFADVDQHPSVQGIGLPRFSASGAARAGRAIACDAVVYLSGFENHPRAVAALAAGRVLWGNPPDVLRRVRDPRIVADALRRRGFGAPDVWVRSAVSRRRPHLGPVDRDGSWLLKPRASGGGRGVRAWHSGTPVPRGSYLQRRLDGRCGSIVFVAAAGDVVPLGITRQLVGERAFGADGFRYCGSILSFVDQRRTLLTDRACALAQAAAEEFGLIGVSGVDFIAGDAEPYAIEVNPRWCASMELCERAAGASVFAAHVAACTTGTLPPPDQFRTRDTGAIGKAVVFARHDVVIGDTHAWLPRDGDGDVRDIPRLGARIRAGGPVCTVFAAGPDVDSCHAALARRAEQVYSDLDAWRRQVA